MSGFTLKGDFSKLREIIKRCEDPAPALEAISKDGAEETLNLISEGFRKGEDPYGRDWDAPNNLQITGRLRSYARGKIGKGGWSVHSTDQKAGWHHAPRPRSAWGGKSLPTRLQVPTSGKGLPTKWSKRFLEMAEDHLKEWFSGG